jgi:hypothetical protein
MAYRNGTYVAFHADGNNLPGGKSDIDYYRLLCAWNANKHHDFQIINTHDKFSAVRDSSKKATLRNALLERLRNSKNMLLIVGETTREDRDWVPFEIEKAVDAYGIPIIVAYTVYTDAIRNPEVLASYWPAALSTRIKDGSASAIHVPFREAPIYAAIEQFSHQNLPIGGGLGIYDNDAYNTWGIW